MRTHRPRTHTARAVASQVLLDGRRSSPTRTIVALGVIVASFGAAAYGVLLAASSFAG